MPEKLSQIVKEFIKTLQVRNSTEEVIRFYHPDIEQIEFPKKLRLL